MFKNRGHVAIISSNQAKYCIEIRIDPLGSCTFFQADLTKYNIPDWIFMSQKDNGLFPLNHL